MISINIFNESKSCKRVPRQKIINVINAVFTDYNINTANINVILLDNTDIKELNIKFLQHKYPTDVITFPFDNDNDAEIYIGVEIANENANKYKVSLSNEILRYVIHGALHLVGYDDKTDAERQKMHELEDKYLSTYKNIKTIYGK